MCLNTTEKSYVARYVGNGSLCCQKNFSAIMFFSGLITQESFVFDLHLLIMVFLLPKREQFGVFLMVQISFSVFAMSVLGGLLASSVRLRLTSLASSPPKTIMAHTEKDIFTLRNNLTVFLWHQKTIISAVQVQEIPFSLKLARFVLS